MRGLELEHIGFAIDGTVVVDDVSLTVAPGEMVCLVGPSGCGKTTTLRIAAGLERPRAGSVMIDGMCVAGPDIFVPPEVRNVGLVLQDYALFPHLNALENVMFGLAALARDEARQRALGLLETLGLGRYAQAYPHTLSGGEQQRVALARALAPEPGVMLLDEPFSGLDSSLRNKVRDQATAILKQLGVPALMVTHDPEEAMRIGDRIAIMRAGRIVQTGVPGEIYDAPADQWAARLFGDLNCLESVAEGGFADTPIGRFSAGAAGNGVPVDILIRPRAIKLGHGEGTPARVTRIRPIGHEILYDLAVDGLNLQVLAPPGGDFAAGSQVRLSVDGEKVFVFPSEGRRS